MMGGGPEERVLVVEYAPEPKTLDDLRKEFPNIEFTYYQVKTDGDESQKTVPKDLYAKATILATFNQLPENLSDAPHLKLVHFFSAGTNHIANHPIYKDSDITLTASNGVHGPQISEWVIMTTLVQSHHYDLLHEAQKERRWASKEYHKAGPVRDQVEKRIGVLGYGSIGRQVGRVAKAMGMEVVAYTASPKKTPDSKKDHGYIVPGTGDPDGSIPSAWYSGLDKPSLHNFLKQDLDIVLVSVPLTKETRGLISTDEFTALASGGRSPLLVNIARGAIVDTDALLDALKSRKLGGASLDVTEPEPLPQDHPLWAAPNVHITPHISGSSERYSERSLQILQQNLRRLAKGEKLINVVDRDRGY